MKAVYGFNHLYLRNNTYYFRFILRRHRVKFQFALSLQSTDFSEAIVSWKKISIETAKLKKLVLAFQKHETEEIGRLVNGFKVSMQKQFKMHHIDPIVAELEQSYSNNAHLLKVLGKNCPLDFPESFHHALKSIYENECGISSDQKLVEYVSDLSSAEKSAFLQYMASMLVRFTEEEQEVNNEGLALTARNTLATHGLEANENSLEFQVLMSKLKSSTQIQNSLIESVANEDGVRERELASLVQTAQPQASTPSVETISDAPLFSEVYNEFLQHKIAKEKLTDKMQQDYARKYLVWQALVEDKPIDLYTPKDIGRFIDRCFELPKMNIAPYSKMSWSERLEVDVPEKDLASTKSVHHYYKWLQGVFAYAKRDTIGYINASPCSIKREFKSRTRGVFDDGELKAFLEVADKEKQLWRKWIVYLGIYTGARRGELVQLRKEDVKFDIPTKRHYLLITDVHESQKLKTGNAKRKIPLHMDLINAGFIDYVESCKERVFDSVNNSEVVTAWFARQLHNLEIDSTNELGHIRSFHSFRHTFITKVMNAGVQVNLVQQVVGHEISSLGITGNYTHKSTELKHVLPVVDELNIPIRD
jgi:integrase